MMYIEHAPLEDNLPDILRNPIIPSSVNGASTVLEAEEAAYTQLRSQPQAETDGYRNRTSNCNHVAPGTATIEGIENYKLKTLKSAQEALTKILESAQAEEHVKEEEVEVFELIDVYDGEEETLTELVPLQQKPEPGQEEEQELQPKAESIEDTDNYSNEIVITIENVGDDKIEYRLLKLPKNTQQKEEEIYILNRTNSSTEAVGETLSLEKPTTEIVTNSVVEHSQKRKRLRPIPDAIPITVFISKRFQTKGSSLPQQSKDRLPVQVHLLNGVGGHSGANSNRQYSKLSNRNSVCDINNQSEKSYNDTNTNNIDAAEEEEEDELYIDREEHSQMGFDIIGRFRRWLSSNSKYEEQQQERLRKRRAERCLADDISPQQIKYRKVENKFPKYITHTLEDDNVDFAGTFPTKQEKQRILQQSLRPIRNSTYEMTQRRSLHVNETEKPKMRKSIFNAPQTTHKLVRNTSYADVEFSDDDEPFITTQDFGFTSGRVLSSNEKIAPQSIFSATGASSSIAGASLSKAYNIPSMHSRNNETTQFSLKPPVFGERSASILASSLMPERKPTYAEALRQNMNSSGGHTVGGCMSSSISSSGVSTSGSVRGLDNARTNIWSLNSRSILAQEIETEEREKYKQLLEQVVPAIYGSDSGNLRRTNYDNLAARRRSGMLLAAARNSNRKLLNGRPALKRPQLSSTIILDDDDNDNVEPIDLEDNSDHDDDVTFTGVSHLNSSSKSAATNKRVSDTVILDGSDEDISEIVDLCDAEHAMLKTCNKLKERECATHANVEKKRTINELPYVEPVNSLRDRFEVSPHLKSNWLENWYSKWNERKKNRVQELIETEKVVNKLTADRCAAESELHERLRNFQIVDPECLVIDEFPEPEEEPEFIELTKDYQERIRAALFGPPEQVLISKFNLNITRRDILTLSGTNWLNDEIINFYMNLLTERGELKHESHGMPRVYAMNTFFVPRLLQVGFSGVKRWTRKVDIFAMDIIPVPVHVGGVHWCMAIIHMKNRTIKYYDSMGTPNSNVLSALEQYMKDESIDKRKVPFDTSGFEVVSVSDVPRQMNGSDCGVFSCMFAEYITRNKEITFSQQHMEYFRHKMIVEITQGSLLQ